MAKLTSSHNLQIVNPELAKQWHPTKNGTLTPRDVTPGSAKKVWWICDKKHEWAATIRSRSRGRRCPYCMGKFACEDNCLQTLDPELAKQWHPTKNGVLTPMKVTQFSSRKVWWICDKKHEWRAEVYRRSYGKGCPYCYRNAVCLDISLHTKKPKLHTKYPKLSKEWHPKKNGQLTPKNITPGSNRKVWWTCKNGHEWQAVVKNRVRGTKCPFCSRRRAMLKRLHHLIYEVNSLNTKYWPT